MIETSVRLSLSEINTLLILCDHVIGITNPDNEQDEIVRERIFKISNKLEKALPGEEYTEHDAIKASKQDIF